MDVPGGLPGAGRVADEQREFMEQPESLFMANAKELTHGSV
jgi:hypothetical protein